MKAAKPIEDTVLENMELPTKLFLKGGLFPFKHERYTVVEETEAPPFLRLEALDADLAFHVLDPFLLMDDYAPEVSDEDSDTLELNDREELQMLCIVNLNQDAMNATINLVAPIIINRRTGIGKQVILQNAAHFSVKHRLFS